MLETLLMNLAMNKVQRRTLEGRDYLVAPVVMLTEGVHYGNNGPLYYSKEELSTNPGAWNHMPVIIYHAVRNGRSVSAADPVVMEAQKVGFLLNSTWNGKLRAEAWLEISRLEQVDKRVLDAINRGEMVEVSTGLYTQNEPKVGEFNGKPYVAIARNYRPDHLAILPDCKGACSIEDGAGLLQTNEYTDGRDFTPEQRLKMVKEKIAMPDGSYPVTNEEDVTSTVKAHVQAKNPEAVKRHVIKRAKALGLTKLLPADWNLTTNATVPDMSFRDIQSALCDALASTYGEPGKEWMGYVVDIFPSKVIYMGDGNLYAVAYSISDTGEITFDGDPAEVTRSTEYKTTDGQYVGNAGGIILNQRGEASMTKEEKINGLITANVGWSPADKDVLMGMTDQQLDRVIAAQGTKKDDKKPDENKPDEKPVEKPAVTVPATGNTTNALTMEQWLAAQPPQYRAIMERALAHEQAEKEQLVSSITSNAANTFTKEFLETQTLEVLRAMARLSSGGQPASDNRLPLYAGAATIAPTTNNQPVQPVLPLPVMDFGKK